jgi:glycosyltransferase involved in cell wall biosynthesis
MPWRNSPIPSTPERNTASSGFVGPNFSPGKKPLRKYSGFSGAFSDATPDPDAGFVSMSSPDSTTTPTAAPVVVLDARWIFPEISGIGAYTLALLQAWAKKDSSPVRMRVLFDRPEVMERTVRDCGLELHPWIEPALFPFSPFHWKSQVVLPRLLASWNASLFHAPNYLVPLTGKTPVLTTIHDLIPLKFPHFTPKAKKTRILPLYRWLMRRVAARCSAILTDSETSRKDIEELLLPARRRDIVHAIPCGVDRRFLECGPSLANPPPPYRILYVGRADPYKNLTGLIRTLEILRETHQLDVTLTLVSKPDPRYPEAENLIRELQLQDKVRWTGPVSNDDLLRAYRSHHCLLHLSRYEGFGLPVLEAMACGLPVISSDGGSLSEIAADIIPTVSPDDYESAAERVQAILTRPELAERIIEQGRSHARKYEWEKTAEATMDVYQRIIGQNKGMAFLPQQE